LEAQWKTTRGYVENVAFAIALAATDERAAERIYNVADELDYTEAQWASLVTKTCGFECSVLTAGSEDLPDKLKSQGNFAHNLLTSSKRIRDELKYKEPVTLTQALSRTIAWERTAPAKLCTSEHFDYEVEDLFLKKRLTT
jgi:nucleoside-diphosphate-sugar epimerase